jgi:replication factor A1
METSNYKKMVEKMAQVSELSLEEIESKIKAKREKLSGLISEEGAAQVVAAEIGINLDNETFKIKELTPNMKKVNLVAKVIRLFPVRIFTRNEKESKVANFIIADETSNIKAVLWDVNHIELLEKGEVEEGSVIEISNARMKDNEIHLGSFSELKKSNKNIEDVKTERVAKEKNLSEVNIGEGIQTRAFMVQSFPVRFFNVCPECNKKPNQEGDKFVCNTHGEITPEKRGLINVILDDGSETIRAVAFHETLKEMGITEFDDPEKLSCQIEDLKGEELIFSGIIRKNTYFNEPEFTINSVKKIDLSKLLEELEN